MKESLRLFGIASAGFEDIHSAAYEKKNDNQVFEEASNIKDAQERETYLEKYYKLYQLAMLNQKGF